VNQTIDHRLQEAKARCAQRAELTEKVPKLRDAIGQCDYRLQILEASLNTIVRQAAKLNAVSLGRILSGLTGTRRQKTAELEEQAKEIQSQVDECADALAALTEEFERASAQLESLKDAELEFQKLLDEKRKSAVQSGAPAAASLSDVEAEFETLKEAQRNVKKAIEIGEAMRERAHQMTKALGRGKTALMFGRPGAAITNFVARQGASGSMKRAEQGVSQLAERILKINLNPEVEIDAELLRVAANLDAAGSTLSEDSTGRYLCDMGMASPLLDAIQEALGLLRMKLELVEPRLKKVTEERRQLIESL
jgi:DNA repair exonuclease SbcCD ATPase subunit